MNDLTIDGFGQFFLDVHGFSPYPWQTELARRALTGSWPQAVEIPTGLGKTSALTAAVYAQAAQPAAPTRIAYVIDRRTVVDAAYQEALRIQFCLCQALGLSAANAPASEAPRLISTLTREVAERLAGRAGAFRGAKEPPLLVSRLRGGTERDDDWILSPITPAIVIATVDQFGSRLLHRGYGVSEASRPIHAGLLAWDTLLFLDEPQLSVALTQTLAHVAQRQANAQPPGQVEPLRTVVLGATLPIASTKQQARDLGQAADDETAPDDRLALSAEDLGIERVKSLLSIRKPIRLVKGGRDSTSAFAAEATRAVASGAKRVAVMVNHVATAREVWRALQGKGDMVVELVIGRSRPYDRQAIERRLLATCGPAPTRSPETPLVVISTQTLEVGADLSFDAVVSEAAPWPNLVQRAGRMRRRGEEQAGELQPFTIVATRTDHPAYGEATAATLAGLRTWLEIDPEAEIGFRGIQAANEAGYFPPGCQPPVEDAPIPVADVFDTWAMTRPTPVPDIPVAPYLHGRLDVTDDVRFAWRDGVADLVAALGQAESSSGRTGEFDDADLGLDALPIRVGETAEVSVAAARRLLCSNGSDDGLTDDVTFAEESRAPFAIRHNVLVKRRGSWRLFDRGRLRPGDLILADCAIGGLISRPTVDGAGEEWLGWDPAARKPAGDIAELTIGPAGWQRRLRSLEAELKKHGGELMGASTAGERMEQLRHELNEAWEAGLSRREMKQTLAAAADTIRELVADLPGAWVLPASESEAEEWLESAILQPQVAGGVVTDWILTSTSGLARWERGTQSSESITEHGGRVAALTREVAAARHLGPTEELVSAAFHHDDGKRDPRWQRAAGNHDQSRQPLAKSGRTRTPAEERRARADSGLPVAWRHEALSASLLEQQGATDLTVHLSAAHHGWGHPFFPGTEDPAGLQRPGRGRATANRRLRGRFGDWGLSYLEAVVRLSDWRASANPGAITPVSDVVVPVGQQLGAGETTVRMTGLEGSNLADYCAAVGLLRELAVTEPAATLQWEGVTPVLTWRPVDDRGFFDTAIENAANLVSVIEELTGRENPLDGGSSKIPVPEFRALETRFAAKGNADALRWLAGCHIETQRLASDPGKVGASAAAIWSQGRSAPWDRVAEIAKAVDDAQSPSRRKANKAALAINEVGNALVGGPGEIHALRAEGAKTYGLDFRSGSYRAKADQDTGYVPLLAGFAVLGFNALWRPRTRTATTGGSRRRHEDPMELRLLLNSDPMTLDDLLYATMLPDLLHRNDIGQILIATQTKVGRTATFYSAARPAPSPRRGGASQAARRSQ